MTWTQNFHAWWHMETVILITMPLQSKVIKLIAAYFNCFFPVCHDNGSQGRILRVDLEVIYRPEPVEHEVLLIPKMSKQYYTSLKDLC